jgi:hypothetical protein
MSDLGDLLELLHGAPRSFWSVHLTAATSWDDDWAMDCVARHMWGGQTSEELREHERRRRASSQGHPSPPGSCPGVRQWEAWITEQKQREDITSEWSAHILRWNGDRCCIEGPNPTYVGSQRQVGETGIPWHQLESRLILDPSGLSATSVLTVIGRTTALGREAILARAEPRRYSRRGELDEDYLSFNCDHLLVTVDVERGFLLVSERFVKDKSVSSTVVETIEFDQPQPDLLFDF